MPEADDARFLSHSVIWTLLSGPVRCHFHARVKRAERALLQLKKAPSCRNGACHEHLLISSSPDTQRARKRVYSFNRHNIGVGRRLRWKRQTEGECVTAQHCGAELSVNRDLM